jgi:aspartyl-tRNA(Asn)/glutamyl-tRNA(Gln) amidotransferase subunit A
MAAGVRTGEITAVDLVARHLDRSEALQDDLNAYTLIDREGALQRAAAIDQRVAAGEDPGPLSGVPVAVKDLIDQAGLPTTCGSSFYRVTPTDSAPAVSRLEEAGAVIIGRTGLHEFAFGFSSENEWFGPVRNPWDPTTAPGGSSGGSAVAVAAGMAAASLGTDTGGSVRVPAALCGIVGLKVTHGRVPITGVFPLAPSLDTVGPMARNVTDTALLYHAIAGDYPPDPWSSPRPVIECDGPASLEGVRIGLPHPWLEFPTEAAVRTAFDTALGAAVDLGATLVELTITELDPPGQVGEVFAPEVAAIHRTMFRDHRAEYGTETAKRIAGTLDVEQDQHIAAKRWQAGLRNAALRAFASVDLLATPTVAARSKTIGDDRIRFDGHDLDYRAAWSSFSSPVNQLGYPALTLPLPIPDGPPASLQLIGPAWSEHRLLGLALTLEEAGIVGFRPPPEV